jgi:hypothetical protein
VLVIGYWLKQQQRNITIQQFQTRTGQGQSQQKTPHHKISISVDKYDIHAPLKTLHLPYSPALPTLNNRSGSTKFQIFMNFRERKCYQIFEKNIFLYIINYKYIISNINYIINYK